MIKIIRILCKWYLHVYANTFDYKVKLYVLFIALEAVYSS